MKEIFDESFLPLKVQRKIAYLFGKEYWPHIHQKLIYNNKELII